MPNKNIEPSLPNPSVEDHAAIAAKKAWRAKLGQNLFARNRTPAESAVVTSDNSDSNDDHAPRSAASSAHESIDLDLNNDRAIFGAPSPYDANNTDILDRPTHSSQLPDADPASVPDADTSQQLRVNLPRVPRGNYPYSMVVTRVEQLFEGTHEEKKIGFFDQDTIDYINTPRGKKSWKNWRGEKNPMPEETPLSELTFARSVLAEASFAARDGSLAMGMTKKKHEKATTAYGQALKAYIDEITTEHGANLSPKEQEQLRTEFYEREKGVLGGEEAQHYLTETEDASGSFITRNAKRFNKLSTGNKILVTAIGGAAIAGLGFGLAITGGAAGAAVAVKSAKLSRNLFKAEAKRLEAKGLVDENVTDLQKAQAEKDVLVAAKNGKKMTVNQILDLRQRQKDSTLRDLSSDFRIDNTTGAAMSYEFEYKQAYDGYVAEKRMQKNVFTMDYAAFKYDRQFNRGTTAIELQLEEESMRKRKAAGKAVIATFAGGAIGAAIEYIPGVDRVTGSMQNWVSDHNPFAGHGSNDNAPTDNKPEVKPPAAPKPPVVEVPKLSPESQYLFGDYAKYPMINIQVPEGSSIWDQLQQTVDTNSPNLPYEEKQRLVGNMVDALRAQNPGIDLDNIPADFTTQLVIPRA